MIKITCTNCQKPLSLDETKLPNKEVTFPCPVCKTKLVVDKRNLGAGAPAAQPAAPVAAPAGGGADEDDDDNENEFGAKAFIVGTDNPAIRQAAKLIGFLPVHYPTAEQARDRYMQELPQVIFLSPAQMSPPPLEGMQPIVSLTPADRRKSFFILVADNLRTLDGNAAFLYGVNLIVAPKDLGNFPQIYKDAYTYHERLYSNMFAIMRAAENA
ncbi:MAG TPA: hypothetical protein VFL80_08160 [Thermoanaerobaculia bacterium]|nr:hypothetical protein [Thermoanaerobaculia bacterium]